MHIHHGFHNRIFSSTLGDMNWITSLTQGADEAESSQGAVENFEAKIGLKDNIACAVYSLYRPSEDKFQGVCGNNCLCSQSLDAPIDSVKMLFLMSF